MTKTRMVTPNDVCAICERPIIYVNPPTIGGKPVCDTCARANVSDVMRDDTVNNCRDCDIYDVCESRVCDGGELPKCPMDTNLDILVDESNLTVARYCNRITIAIAHDGMVNVGNGYDDGVLDNVIDLVCRCGIDRVVTCLTIVVASNIRYCVTAITPSQSVWNINIHTIRQITTALNTIGVKLN